ncbi:lactate utilization protein [bacterium]|nr:lactate utilization protein [bacterium]
MIQSKFITKRNDILAEKLINNLKKRFFDAYYVQNKEDALKKAVEIIQNTDVVAWGGSSSVVETGLIDYLIKNKYNVINRDTAKNPEERLELLRKSLLSDVYLMGTNALSKDGQLVNIDCIGNRTAALMFGPKKVIVIAGMNKISNDLDEAINRARKFAAPVNMQRISEKNTRETPCCKTGECFDCLSKDSICSHIVVTRLCNPQYRIKIILVNDNLGF